MPKRFIYLILLVFLSACGTGDGWYESKDWGKWAKSDGGRWYGDGTNEEEESWWCEFTNTCEEEKSVACTQYGNCGDDADTSVACTLYGNCDDDGDGQKDKDDSVACSMYGNCDKDGDGDKDAKSDDTSTACTFYGNCDKDGDGDKDAKGEDTSAACSFYGNCKAQ